MPEEFALTSAKRQKRDEPRLHQDNVVPRVVAERFLSPERWEDVSDDPHIWVVNDQPSPAHVSRLPSLASTFSRDRISHNKVHNPTLVASIPPISSPRVIEGQSDMRGKTFRRGLAHDNLKILAHLTIRTEFCANPMRHATDTAVESAQRPFHERYARKPPDDKASLNAFPTANLRSDSSNSFIIHAPPPSFPTSSFTPDAYVIASEDPAPVLVRKADPNFEHMAIEMTVVRKGINPVLSTSKTHARIISEFEPIATSTQRPARPQSPQPIKSKVSAPLNAKQAERGSEPDQVMKSAPNPVQRTAVVLDNLHAAPVSALEARNNIIAIPFTVSAGESSTSKQKTLVAQKKSAIMKGKKFEKARVTPLAYAQTLCDKIGTVSKKTDFLAGKRVFYAGGDMHYASDATKKKMTLVRVRRTRLALLCLTNFSRSLRTVAF